MTFLRGAQAETVVAHRFREEVEAFALWREGACWIGRTDATAERTLALFHALSAEMPGTVSVSFTRVRDGAESVGLALALSDVREGIARLRPALARTGGVVVTLWGDDRQLSLSAQLSVWLWSNTPAWRSALLAQGLVDVSPPKLTDRRWAAAREELAGSRDLDLVLDAVTTRLGLAAPTRTQRD